MFAQKILAALAAASLAAAPVAAQPAPAPAPETVEGSALRGEPKAYYILPVLVLIALLVAVLKGEEGPSSP
jgi:hypothetical protein